MSGSPQMEASLAKRRRQVDSQLGEEGKECREACQCQADFPPCAGIGARGPFEGTGEGLKESL